MRSWLPILALLAACGDPYEGWPDLRGRFNVQLTQTEGCPTAPNHVGWIAGPLLITGETPDLSFDFGQDLVFSGTSTEGGRFSFRGEAASPLGDDTYAVSGRGSSSGASPQLQLEGTVDVEIDGAQDGCIYTGGFTAPQVGS